MIRKHTYRAKSFAAAAMMLTLAACQSENLVAPDPDADTPITLAAQLTGMGASVDTRSAATRATTYATPGKTPADGEILDLGVLNAGSGTATTSAITTNFFCPALPDHGFSYVGGNLTTDGSGAKLYTSYNDADAGTNAYIPLHSDLNTTSGVTQQAWMAMFGFSKGDGVAKDFILGKATRSAAHYTFSLTHQQPKFSVVMLDRNGAPLADTYFADATNEANNLQVKIEYMQLSEGSDIVCETRENGNGNIVLKNNGRLTPAEWQAVTDIKTITVMNNGHSSLPLKRPAALFAAATPAYMPNLFNILLPNSGTLKGAIGDRYNRNSATGIYTKLEASTTDEDAALIITIPTALSATGAEQTFTLKCSDIALGGLADNDSRIDGMLTADRNASGKPGYWGYLTAINPGEHAVISVKVDPKEGVSATATVSSWYEAEAGITVGADPSDDPARIRFQDANFRNYLVGLGFKLTADGADIDLTDSGNKALFASTTTIHVTGSEKDDNEKITSLQGIEYFTELTTLYCSSNRLTALDVSKNTKLTTLYCASNQLTALDVSKNTKLTTLHCNSNRLTALDVSKNTKLKSLIGNGNRLTVLDVSKNTELTTLYCSSDQLTALDVSKNAELTTLYCNNNQLSDLDISKNAKLMYLDCSSNGLTALDATTMGPNHAEDYYLLCGNQTANGNSNGTPLTLTLKLTTAMKSRWEEEMKPNTAWNNFNARVTVTDPGASE